MCLPDRDIKWPRPTDHPVMFLYELFVRKAMD